MQFAAAIADPSRAGALRDRAGSSACSTGCPSRSRPSQKRLAFHPLLAVEVPRALGLRRCTSKLALAIGSSMPKLAPLHLGHLPSGLCETSARREVGFLPRFRLGSQTRVLRTCSLPMTTSR